jgi:hypothetical protein
MDSEYKVLSAARQDRMGPTGGHTTVYVVWLETRRGANGSVEIEEGVWKSDQLKAALQDAANDLDRAFTV